MFGFVFFLHSYSAQIAALMVYLASANRGNYTERDMPREDNRPATMEDSLFTLERKRVSRGEVPDIET